MSIKIPVIELLINSGFEIIPIIESDSKHWFPIKCPKGHINRKMTRTRIRELYRQNKNFCVICRKNNKKEVRFNLINNKLESVGAKLLKLKDDRTIEYLCKCGKLCNSWDSCIFNKKDIIGCNRCANPFNNPEIQSEIKINNLKKYGVENVMHNKEIFKHQSTSSFKRKKYILPSGKIIKLMGYEPLCLTYLLTLYKEEEIITNISDIPSFNYIFEGKNRKYYPDFYIPKENLIIEVKSPWTFQKYFDQNYEKINAVNNSGYNLDLYIFNDREKMILHQTFGKI